MIGPVSEFENRVKNSIATPMPDDKVGHIDDGLEEALKPQLNRRSVNHAASTSDSMISGINPISHMIMVLLKYWHLLDHGGIVFQPYKVRADDL